MVATFFAGSDLLLQPNNTEPRKMLRRDQCKRRKSFGLALVSADLALSIENRLERRLDALKEVFKVALAASPVQARLVELAVVARRLELLTSTAT
jgi:hypothetical protein